MPLPRCIQVPQMEYESDIRSLDFIILDGCRRDDRLGEHRDVSSIPILQVLRAKPKIATRLSSVLLEASTKP